MSKATPTPAAATTKPRKPRKPRIPGMTMLQRFELQSFLKDSPATTPDATVAKKASEKFGRPVLPATVAEYRKAFGIKPVARPSYAQLEAYIDLLYEALGSAGVPVPAVAVDGGAA